MADLELLLGVLEEGHEGPLGALGQLRRAHRDVKPGGGQGRDDGLDRGQIAFST